MALHSARQKLRDSESPKPQESGHRQIAARVASLFGSGFTGTRSSAFTPRRAFGRRIGGFSRAGTLGRSKRYLTGSSSRRLSMKKLSVTAAAVAIGLFAAVSGAQAQGIIGGAQQGAYEGNRAAGPIGGAVGTVVGGAVGGAVGGVKGVLGIPQHTYYGHRAYRHHAYRSHHVRHRYVRNGTVYYR
jgi:hypothetical protein